MRPNVAELEAIFVEPRFIGKGICKKLIEHARAGAIAGGADQIIIQGDPHVERFYLKIGAVHMGCRESGSVPGRQLPLFEILLPKNTGEKEIVDV